MPDLFWAWTARVAATVAGLTALAACWPGPPPGRWLLAALLACLSTGLFWVAAMQAGAAPDWLGSLVWRTSVVLSPLTIAVAARFGQPVAMLARGGIVPLALSTIVAAALLAWGAGAGSGVLVFRSDGHDPVLRLISGPGRAGAVSILLSSCYAVVRLHSVHSAARRAGLGALARGCIAVSGGCALLFLASSQILLYGALPLELLCFGSLAIVPLCVLGAPALTHGHGPKPVLPASAQLQSSIFLVLALGLFLIALAAIGLFVHEVMPEQGVLLFRWGAVAVMLLLLGLLSIPGVRRPIAALVDRDLGPAGWDFRREWARANEVLTDSTSIDDLANRLRAHLDSLLGAQRVFLWWGGEDGSLDPHPQNDALTPMHTENPLRPKLQEVGGILEVSYPARHLEEIPIIVENREAIETLGLRIFVSLSCRGSEGVLAIAPPVGFVLDADQRALLSNIGGTVAAYARLLDRSSNREAEVPVAGDPHGTR